MRYRQHLMAALVLVAALALQSGAVLAQPVITRTVTVQGVGLIPVEPNGAFFDVSLGAVSTDLPEAYRQMRQRIQAVTDAVVAIGVSPEDIRFITFRVEPEDIVDQDIGNRPSGEFLYRLSVTLRITVRQFALIDAVVQGAIDQGITAVNNFFPLYDDVSQLEREARALAIQEARAIAQSYADANGLLLGNIVSSSESVVSGFSEFLIADSTLGRFNVTVIVTADFEVKVPDL